MHRLATEADERFMDVCGRPPGEPSICVVILNGRTLRLPRDLQREPKTGDELHLIPPSRVGEACGEFLIVLEPPTIQGR